MKAGRNGPGGRKGKNGGDAMGKTDIAVELKKIHTTV